MSSSVLELSVVAAVAVAAVTIVEFEIEVAAVTVVEFAVGVAAER